MRMKWWEKISLRTRIYAILVALVLITLAGGAVMIWYTYRMEGLCKSVITKDVAAMQAAQELEIALAKQKGLISYYVLDNDPAWLDQLEKYQNDFQAQFDKTKKLARGQTAVNLLSRIESQYGEYLNLKNRVIALSKAGDKETASKLNREARAKFLQILDLCDEYKNILNEWINEALAASHSEAKHLRIIAATAMSSAALLGALLSFVLAAQILDPIRKMSLVAEKGSGQAETGDEIKTLGWRVKGLIQNMDKTHVELERSRQRLLHSEKMAVVGQMAAGVAHSIRNPMTSINMRLFSLERTLHLAPAQKEDFEVVREEMRRLENIVRNFLEFSRPAKLKMQLVNVSDIVDMTLLLLQNRLELYGVKVERERPLSLSPVEADPEQLKEVLVNLIVNACEAMKEGGKLTVVEKEEDSEQIGPAVSIQISDTGPGIPASIRDKVMEPFFSTKEDGTGLGLSIALRIVEEHGGRLELLPTEGKGATFVIKLPVWEGN